MKFATYLHIVLCTTLFTCTSLAQQEETMPPQFQTGADQIPLVLAITKNKRVGLVVNPSSRVGNTHLADTLMSLGVQVKKIFAPEHGFRGVVENGVDIKDGMDSKLGIPIISIYGNSKKPSTEQLQDIDLVIFDIQDVGVRYFTYVGTMHYVMEACAENKIKFVVLDRPNPNGSYIDGPVLDLAFKSFTGMHKVPIVHGLTVGEYARMINGEGWLSQGIKCDLKIISMMHWKHVDNYSLPVKPSPNLPNDLSIKLYPSICLFEGTKISLGRGTEFPFQVLGSPLLKGMPFSFTPRSIEGMSTNPPFKDQECYGIDLRQVKPEKRIMLKYILEMYAAYPEKDNFFTKYFNTLAGTDQLQKQIKTGLSEEEIRKSWRPALSEYIEMRKKYLIYE